MAVVQCDPVPETLPRRGNRLSRTIALTVLSAMRWRITGALPGVPRVVLIGAPHTSNWDFVVGIATAWTLGVRVTWIGKQELFRPPFSAFFRWLGGIPVDRSVSTGFVDQTVAALQQHERFMLAIAPEGTRKAVAKWRTGFYYIALGVQAPIVLVTFDRARRVIHLGPSVTPTGDLEGDLARIRSLYDGILAQ